MPTRNFSVHGVSQARTLEWVAISFSRGSSQSRDQTMSPAWQVGSLITEPLGKPGVVVQSQHNSALYNAAQGECWAHISQGDVCLLLSPSGIGEFDERVHIAQHCELHLLGAQSVAERGTYLLQKEADKAGK